MNIVSIDGRDRLMTDKELYGPKPKPPKPWERQPKESSRAYEAFTIYRDMGSRRTIKAAARKAGKGERAFDRWACKYHWSKRIKAWEEEMEKLAWEAERDERWKRARKHARQGELLQKKAKRYMKRHSLRSNREALDFMEVGIKTEREAYGDSRFDEPAAQPAVQVNLLGEITSEVEQFRRQLIAEVSRELAAKQIRAIEHAPTPAGDYIDAEIERITSTNGECLNGGD